jgi:hypothetical protein
MNTIFHWASRLQRFVREKNEIARRERGWTHGGGSLRIPSKALANARQEMEAGNSPDWILMLRGVGLPHGARIDVTLRLWEDKPAASITEWSQQWTRQGRYAIEATQSTKALTSADCSLFLAVLHQENYSDLGKDETGVRDGFPCTLAILRRSDRTLKTANCNLCGFIYHTDLPPAPKLMSLMTNWGTSRE